MGEKMHNHFSGVINVKPCLGCGCAVLQLLSTTQQTRSLNAVGMYSDATNEKIESWQIKCPQCGALSERHAQLSRVIKAWNAGKQGGDGGGYILHVGPRDKATE